MKKIVDKAGILWKQLGHNITENRKIKHFKTKTISSLSSLNVFNHKIFLKNYFLMLNKNLLTDNMQYYQLFFK